MKQTIEIEVPDGLEVETIRRLYELPDHTDMQWYCVKLRRVHVWPEWLLQLARIHGPWFVIDPNGDAYLCDVDPVDRIRAWVCAGTSWRLPNEWVGYAPPHDHTGDGWRKCKWKLPI